VGKSKYEIGQTVQAIGYVSTLQAGAIGYLLKGVSMDKLAWQRYKPWHETARACTRLFVMTTNKKHLELRRARDFLRYREAVTSLYTYGYGRFRVYFLALGDLLARRGVLASREDVFYLYSVHPNPPLQDHVQPTVAIAVLVFELPVRHHLQKELESILWYRRQAGGKRRSTRRIRG
jgi:hypothetical protein